MSNFQEFQKQKTVHTVMKGLIQENFPKLKVVMLSRLEGPVMDSEKHTKG